MLQDNKTIKQTPDQVKATADTAKETKQDAVLDSNERQTLMAHMSTLKDQESTTQTDRFNEAMKLTFGSAKDALNFGEYLGISSEYERLIVNEGEETMRKEMESLSQRGRQDGDPQWWFSSENEIMKHWKYVVHDTCSEEEYPNGTRDKGRPPTNLEGFMQKQEVKTAQLERSHVIALRIYTTLVYKYINGPLRNKELYRTYPDQPDQPRHPLAAVVFYIFQGIKMLRNCAKDLHGGIVLWRGVKSVKADQNFLDNGGTELAPMSTTTKLEVALGYLNGMTLSQGAVLFKLAITSKLKMGAELAWLSAFPSEAEVLYPPMTFLEVEKQYRRDENGEELDTKEPRQEVVSKFISFFCLKL